MAFDRLSIRGGYKFEQSPNINTTLNSDSLINFTDINGYSLGGGYNFGNFKFDLSYSDNNNTGQYNFYPQFSNIDASNLSFDNRTVTATFTINL
jgi:hypothetical protein